MGLVGSPFAVYPFGAGAPATATAPPVVPALTAAFIEPSSRDYVLTPDFETARMPSVRQQMLIALTTVKGSSTAFPELGIALPKKIDENAGHAVKLAVIAAAKHITAAGRARILDVQTEQGWMGMLRILVSYRDLINGENRQLSIGAPGSASGGGGSGGGEELSFLGDTLTTGGDTLTT